MSYSSAWTPVVAFSHGWTCMTLDINWTNTLCSEDSARRTGRNHALSSRAEALLSWAAESCQAALQDFHDWRDSLQGDLWLFRETFSLLRVPFPHCSSEASSFLFGLLVTTCLPAPLGDHAAASQPTTPPPPAVLSGRGALAPALALPAASQMLRALAQPDAPQHQQRVGHRAEHPSSEEATPQPHHLHRAAADGPGEEVPEAEVPVYTW